MASRGLWHFMSARTRRSLALSWSALFVLSLLLQYFSFAVASPVSAAVGGGEFELDGNAVDGNSAAALPDDWDRVFANTDNADSAIFTTDGFNLNDDILTGGSTKDGIDIPSWLWKVGSVQDKDDIENAFAASYTAGSPAHTFVYFGLDRYQTSGDATAGFWFLKSGLAKSGNGSGNGTGFTGTHVNGDILVVLDFSNGGATASAQVYTWQNGALAAGPSGGLCTAPPAVQTVCAIANTSPQSSPWTYDDKSVAGADNDFPANALFEGGIDLTALQLDTGCFSTFLAETRSSNSVTSTLSDFTMGSFSLCATPDITTQVKKDGQSTGSNGHITIGESVTDSVHITGSKGTPTGTVDFYHCFSASVTPTCTVSGTPFDTKTLSGGDATSKAFTPTAVGNYCFIVDYHPAAGSHYLPSSHTNSTTECFVVDKQPTSITTSADETVSIGATIHDTAVLHDATADATGTITFRAWGPGTSCSGTAAFTSTATVAGGTTTYQSGDFTPLTAGVFHWIASYSGDAKNAASTGVCLATGENDTVEKVTPSISTVASDPNGITVGGAITDTATVSGGHSPTGSVTFNLYGPDDNDCSGPAIFTSINRPLSGGSATSEPFTTSDVGTYIWIATYNGDANNNPISGKCTDANESVDVNPTNPKITTTLVGGGQSGAHITVPLGTAVHDTAILTGATADAGGTVQYQVFTNATCDSTATNAGLANVVNGVVGNSFSIVFGHAGTFYWQADYSGDANNNPASSACNLETVTLDKAIPTITTNASATVEVGGDISDTATLAGGFGPTGTITFNLYGPDDDDCLGPVAFSSTVNVTKNGDYESGPFTTSAAGTYHWIAIYSGDGDNGAVQGDCGDANENVVVTPASPIVTTNASDSVIVGAGDISDTATLAGGFNPTGTITFTLFDNDTCAGTPLATSAVSVAGNSDYVSDPYTPTHAGTYHWIANYSGDDNNKATANGCGLPNENVVVTPASPTVTTNASDSVIVGAGDISDTATLAGGFNPTGTITFTLFDNDTCAGTPLATSAVSVAGNSDYVSDPYTPTHAGTYHWIANYSGDDNNKATANGCGLPNENVVVTPASPRIRTLATVGGQVGDLISDKAFVEGGFNPTGTVDFWLYSWDDADCLGQPIFSDLDVALGIDGTATSGTFQVTHEGEYHWIASYGGDDNNKAVTGTCGDQGETTTIKKFAPSITTSLTSGETTAPKITVVFGSDVTDQATLHEASPTAGGTVTYSVYGNPNCSGEPIADGGTKTVVNGVVPASDPVTFPTAGTYYWQAFYSGDDANAPAMSVCTDEVVTVTTPDLNVEKLVATGDGEFAGTSTAEPGDVVHYQITVNNSGDADANDVPVTDDIAAILAHATYNGDCSNACDFAGNVLSWTIDVGVDETVTLTFSVTLADTFPDGTTHLPNVVVVTGPGSNCPEASEDEDCDTDTTVGAAPDLNVEKLVAINDGDLVHSGTANPGDTLNYQITVHNSGNANATDVPVSDDLSAILAHGTYNGDCSNSCSFADDTVTWTIDVDAGETVTLTFSVTLDDTFPTGTTDLPNVVVVTGPGSNCPEASQDGDCEAGTSVSASVLVIEKSFTGNTGGTDPELGVPAANVGDTLHYSLKYTGGGTLTDAVITDVLPQGLAFVAGSAHGNADFNDGTYDSATRTITWLAKGVLPDPAGGAVTYDVKVLATAPDFAQPLVNLAKIDSDETEPDTDTASVAVLAPPLELTPPPTSTLTPESAPSNPGFALMLILLGVAGLTLGIGFVTPTPERVRRRNRLG